MSSLDRDSIAERNRDFYERLLTRRPPVPGENEVAQRSGYRSRASQYLNFREATAHVDIVTLPAVLDLGAGLGELALYLHGQGFAGRYLGIELLEDVAQRAQQRLSELPAADVRCVDTLDAPIDEPFELVTCIGVLSANMDKPAPQGDRSRAFADAVIQMVERCSSHQAALHFLDRSYTGNAVDPEWRTEFAHYDATWIISRFAHHAEASGRKASAQLSDRIGNTGRVVRVVFSPR